ncbi:MAG: hypothetical protein ACI9YE_002384 [Psychroserpens sp.]|jgi:hypothetical protein
MKNNKLKIEKFQISSLNCLSNFEGGNPGNGNGEGTGTVDKKELEEPNILNTFSILCNGK